MWFDNFLYIFNMHWDKVDNFRIDKYLMFLRFQFKALLVFLKETEYKYIGWFQTSLKKLFSDSGSGLGASGIVLQICDVFLQEFNSVDSEASLDTISSVLEPFLMTLSTCQTKETRDRINEKIFHPLLENNVTVREVDSEEERVELEKREHYHRHVDGGKLPPKTVKEIEKMLD